MTKKPDCTKNSNGADEAGSAAPEEDVQTTQMLSDSVPPQSFRKAYDALDEALDFLDKGDYETSMQWASTAVSLFEAVRLDDF